MNHERKQADPWIEFSQLCDAIDELPDLVVIEEFSGASDEAQFINPQYQLELELITQELLETTLALRVSRQRRCQ
jgi:hypothetical protein